MPNLDSLKLQYKYEELIKQAIIKYNDSMDELEMSIYINDYEELINNSKYGNKILFKKYENMLYIGINLIQWVGGKVTLNEVYYNFLNREIYIENMNFYTFDNISQLSKVDFK